VERSEAEAAEAGKQQVNAEDLGKVQGGLAGPGVLPDLQIPERPVPDGGQHQQSAENDVRCCHTLETPEAGIHPGFSSNAPTTPAARDTETGHEGHHEHALTPHGVQDRIGWIEDGELIESHGAGPAGNKGCMHEVHGQKAARVIDDDGVHPIPGQSHGSGSGGTESSR
jgi:hypothetical protein